MKLIGLCAATVLVSLAGLAGPARAGASVKAHLECTPTGGKLLKASQTAPLDKDIACVVVVDGGAVPADAKVALTPKLVTPVGLVVATAHPATAADGKRYTADPFTAGSELFPCAGIVLAGSIMQGATSLWSGEVKVTPPACPAPKPVTGRLACAADTDDAYVSYPGNGDKLKPELSSGLTCTITGDKALAKYGVLQVHGATAPAVLRGLAPAGDGQPAIAFTQFLAPVVPKCKSFTVDAALLAPDGAVVWTSKVAIAQTCKKK